jgi:hypothetical protein
VRISFQLRRGVWIFVILLGLIFAGCVSEKKQPDREFLKPTADPASGIVATKITVHCHVQQAKSKKSTPCSQMSVKVLNQVTQKSTTEAYKSGSATVVVGHDVYIVDVATSGCQTVRTFNGLMAGMIIDANFDPPCGLK